MSYISQYEENITKGKYKDKNIETGYKCKEDASVTLLRILNSNDCIPIFPMSRKNIKYVNTDKIIP